MASSPLTKVQQRPLLSTQIEPSLKPKSTITSRMRENDGKFIRQLEQKDQEIIELKRRLNEIAEKRVIQLKKRQLRPLRRPSQRSNLPSIPENMEMMLKTLSNEKLGLERQLQVAKKSIEDLKKTKQDPLNETMLKTIKFKSSLCQDLENKLSLAEQEMVQIKAENFKLLKSLASTNNNRQTNGFESRDYNTLIENHETIFNKIHHLEESLKEKDSKRMDTESGYLSQASSTTSSKFIHVETTQQPPETKQPVVPALEQEEFESMIASSVDLSDILEVSEEESLGEIQPRFCVALQDYFPQIQRPDQLGFGFSAGQLIKVFGLPNEDGMILGEIGNVQAHFPSQLITEINNIAQKKILKVALYDYNPPVQSPNHDSTLELSFLTGDVLHIYGDMDDDGFYYAELNGKRGLVPSNYVSSLQDYPGKYI